MHTINQIQKNWWFEQKRTIIKNQLVHPLRIVKYNSDCDIVGRNYIGFPRQKIKNTIRAATGIKKTLELLTLRRARDCFFSDHLSTIHPCFLEHRDRVV